MEATAKDWVPTEPTRQAEMAAVLPVYRKVAAVGLGMLRRLAAAAAAKG